MVSFLVAGALFGLSVALPFGPVSLVCLQRSLLNGVRNGIASGVGAATAHGLFSGAAMASSGIIAGPLAQWHLIIRLVSAGLLIALGVRTAAKPPAVPEVSPPSGHAAAYMAGLLLALSNPMTILPYAAFASASVMTRDGQAARLSWTVAGVMLGAASWYTALSGFAWLLRSGLPRRVLARLNWLAGGALIGFGFLVGLG